MQKEIELKLIVDDLETCSKTLSEMNIQFQSLYNVINTIKSKDQQEELLYTYKQAYDAFGEHVKSFGRIIRVAKDQVDDEQPQQNKK